MQNLEQKYKIKDMKNVDQKITHQIGMRDMLANLFMEIRTDGIDATLKKYAEMLGDNPHAKHFLEVINK